MFKTMTIAFVAAGVGILAATVALTLVLGTVWYGFINFLIFMGNI